MSYFRGEKLLYFLYYFLNCCADRYGKIGYIINDDTNGPTNGRDHFKIDPVTGIVSPKFENGQSKLEWSDIPEFKINILAVDDYKGDESSLSKINLRHK